MDDDLAERVAALEARIAYQDRTIEDLDKAVAVQWTQIDALTREVAHLAERLQQAEDGRGELLPEPPPPHY
jgi:SlyX protein